MSLGKFELGGALSPFKDPTMGPSSSTGIDRPMMKAIG
jgi:hypothetical protein